jgi:hypothetical protein
MIQLRSYLISIIPRFFALILLVISLVIGLFELVICDRILMFPFFLLMGESRIYRPIYIVSWCLLGVVYLVFLILTSEYHFKHLGKPKSWTLFAKTFSVQLLLMVFDFFV